MITFELDAGDDLGTIIQGLREYAYMLGHDYWIHSLKNHCVQIGAKPHCPELETIVALKWVKN